MKLHPSSLATALALAVALAAPLAMAQDALTERQVHNQLEQQGYKKIHDLKFRDGMWRARAKSADLRGAESRRRSSRSSYVPVPRGSSAEGPIPGSLD